MKSRRITGSILTAALLCGMTGSVLAGNYDRGPYLIYEDNNTEMTVMWGLENLVDCEIKWGTDKSYSDGSLNADADSDGLYKTVLTGLQPGTRYYYTINNGLREGKFWSAPAEDQLNLKFVGFGDTRTNQDITDSVLDEILKLDESYHTFTLLAGDWNNTDGEVKWREQHWLRKYDNMLTAWASIPLMGCRGNHEKEAINFRKYYPYNRPTDDCYYSFEYGPIKVITIDQYVNFAPGSTQYKWVESELASTTKSIKIIQAHEPAWTSGKHGNNIDFQDLQPLFEQYDVAVIFCGHNHVYTRCKVDGLHHITSGGAGAGADPGDDDGNLNDPKVVYTKTVEHFIKFDITNGNQLDAVVIDEHGNEVDSFSYTGVPVGPIVDVPPSMNNVSKTIKVGEVLNLDLSNSVSEPEGDALTFAVTGLPAWASEFAGIVTGMPGSNDVGTVVADVTVSDKDGSATATLTLTVATDDVDPELPTIDAGADIEVETPIGTPAKVTLTAVASAGDIVWKKDTVRVGDGASIEVELAGGVHTFVARIKDAAGNVARDEVVVTVTEIDNGGPNEAPVFKTKTILSTRAKIGKAFSKDISGKAKDADGDLLTFSKADGPAWLKVAANGKLSGTPAASDKGNNRFTIKVSDGKGGEDTASVKVKVK